MLSRAWFFVLHFFLNITFTRGRSVGDVQEYFAAPFLEDYDRRSDSRLNYRSWRSQKLVQKLLRDYIIAVRPGVKSQPVNVMTSVFLDALSAVDEFRMEFKAQFRFQQEWYDPRLEFEDAYFTKDDYLHLSADQLLWVPDTFVPNEKQGAVHTLDQPNQFTKFRGDGMVVYNKRFTMTLACVMHLQKYPMDEQTCFMDFVSYAYTTDDIVYVWSDNPLQIEDLAFSGLSNFEVLSYRNLSCTSKTATGEYGCLRVELRIRRLFSFFILQVYAPSCLLVAVSWVSYWIDWRAAAGRVPLAIVTLLTMITHSHAVNSNLPPVSYAKALDVWVGACVMFIFVSLIEYAFVNYAGLREQHQMAEMRTTTEPNQLMSSQLNAFTSPRYEDQADSLEDCIRRRRKLTIKSTVSVDSGLASEEIKLKDRGNALTEMISRLKLKRRKRFFSQMFSLGSLSKVTSRADKIDIISRYLFPFLFFSFNLIYWSIYWSGASI